MATYQKYIQLVSLFSILIFIPSFVYGQSASQIDYQLESENLAKTKQIAQPQKETEFGLDCPKGAYHGLDNQRVEACRDIISNQIVEPEISEIINLESAEIVNPESTEIVNLESTEIVNLDIEIGAESALPEIIPTDEQTSYVEFGILGLIGIIGGIIGVSRKKFRSAIFQKRRWSADEKEQVRSRQFGRCNMCYREPSRWVYDHFDRKKRYNDISNCQGLCPKCKSERMLIKV